MKSIIRLSRLWFPILILCVAYSAKASLYHLPYFWKPWLPSYVSYQAILGISHSVVLFCTYNLFASFINITQRELTERYPKQAILNRLLPLSQRIKLLIFTLICYQSISAFNIPKGWEYTVHQWVHLAIVGIIGWCGLACIQVGELLFLQYLPSGGRYNIDARRWYTHIAIIKRILILLLAFITTAFMLMTFETIRVAGTAILASAGIFATVVTFSARGFLESIFKGIQLAIAQPLRLGDTVMLNGEVGTVTSITLHHVVVTLSDRSQLIVPVSDLLDKTFKSWTHSSDDLIGNIVLYVKYNLPIEEIRAKFYEYLKVSEHWDQNTAELNVSGLKSNLIELTFIMSAKSSRSFVKLRNEISEQLIKYMQNHYPESLP